MINADVYEEALARADAAERKCRELEGNLFLIGDACGNIDASTAHIAVRALRAERDKIKSELAKAWRPWPPEGPERTVFVLYAKNILQASSTWSLPIPSEVLYREIEEPRP